MRQIMISGFLGADSEVKQTKQGLPYLTFRVGNTEYNDSENGTHWYRVTTFNNRYVNMSKYLTKGKNVIIYGDYNDEIYQGNDGRCMISRDIIANYITFNSTGGGQNNNHNGGFNTQSKPQTNYGEQNVDGVRMPSMGVSNTTTAQPVAQTVNSAVSKEQTDDLPF